MKRQAKQLQSKAKKSQVGQNADGTFTVTSATSGKSYLVAQFDSGFRCCCDWAKYHDTRFKPCSHVLAVEAYLEEAGTRSLSFWASEEDAKRQHRPVRRVGQGVWATSRAAA